GRRDRAGVENAGDVDVVHHRQGLPFGLEAGDDLAAVHARLDDLERDLPANRLGLLGQEDDAHAAFADLLQELVPADDGAGTLVDRWHAHHAPKTGRRYIKRPSGFLVAVQELAYPAQEFGILRAGLLDVRGPLRRRRPVQ